MSEYDYLDDDNSDEYGDYEGLCTAGDVLAAATQIGSPLARSLVLNSDEKDARWMLGTALQLLSIAMCEPAVAAELEKFADRLDAAE